MKPNYLYEILPFLKDAEKTRQEQFVEYFKTAPLWLLDSLKVEELPENAVFIRENAPADKIYIILKGIIKATDSRIFGISYDFMMFNRVHAFGGMEYIMDFSKYRTTLSTVTKCTVVTIPMSIYGKWLSTDIKAMKHEAKLLGQYLLEEARNSRLLLFLQGSDRLALLFVERYEKYNRNGILYVRGNRQDLADETGLCVKSISRAVKKFQEDDLISKEGNQIMVNKKQYEGLKEVLAMKIDRG